MYSRSPNFFKYTCVTTEGWLIALKLHTILNTRVLPPPPFRAQVHMAHSEVIVRVVSTRKLVVFQAADTTLNIKYPGVCSSSQNTECRLHNKEPFPCVGPKPQRECLILHSNVIYADFDRTTRTLTLSYLANNKKKGHLPLVRITGEVQDMENDMASEWAEALMRTVYEGE